MNILVMDDDFSFTNKISKLLEKYAEKNGIDIHIDKASSREELEKVIVNKCSIAFLDIDMGTFSGIRVARKIRAENSEVIIIFVTNFIEYAPEGYEVQAFRYLVKNQIEEKLEEYFESAVNKFVLNHQIISIFINGEQIDIELQKLIYIEALQRIMAAHICEGKRTIYKFYSKMATLEKELAPFGFLRVHKSYLVNMKYIKKLRFTEVTLFNGEILRVSEKNYPEIKRKYYLWRGRQKWSIS